MFVWVLGELFFRSRGRGELPGGGGQERKHADGPTLPFILVFVALELLLARPACWLLLPGQIMNQNWPPKWPQKLRPKTSTGIAFLDFSRKGDPTQGVPSGAMPGGSFFGGCPGCVQ